jgi:hypothetical protein
MEDQKVTEEDSMKQEKTGLLFKRTGHQHLKKNKHFFIANPPHKKLSFLQVEEDLIKHAI